MELDTVILRALKIWQRRYMFNRLENDELALMHADIDSIHDLLESLIEDIEDYQNRHRYPEDD